MTGNNKLGLAVFELNGARLEIECGYEAALKVDTVFQQDIAEWIGETALPVDKKGNQTVSRMGLAKVFYILQVGEQMSQKEIYETFFEGIITGEHDPEEIVKKVFETLDRVVGKKYQEMLPDAPKADGADNVPAKKTPSSSTK